MKIAAGVLCLFFGIASQASATVTFQFSLPFSGGIASNLANASGVVTNGMRWGIIIDTAGNGFANAAANYDAYAPGVGTAGFLSVGGTVTDDYFIPGTLTQDGSGFLEGDFTTPGGSGAILDDLGNISLTNGVAAGQHFALVWFSNNTSANGSRYGFLTDASFVVPGEGATVDFSSLFVGVDPVRAASKTIGVAPANAKIAVFDGIGTGGSALADSTGTIVFPNLVAGTTGGTHTFTLQNTGGLDLTSIAISKGSSGNPGDFTISTTGTATTLAASVTTTFTVTFAPSVTGPRSAVIQIASNDSTQNPFHIAVSGTGTFTAGPSITVFDGGGTTGNQRADNASPFIFAATQLRATGPSQTFTIQNNGTATVLDLKAAISTLDSGDYDLLSGGLASTLAPNASTSFTVNFHPRTAGTRTAVITLYSTSHSIPDYRVNVSGRGAAFSDQRIDVFQGSTSGVELANNAVIAFPTTLPNSSSATQTYTIQNIGVADLTGISVAKVASADFVLDTTGTLATLSSGDTTTFTVTFHPTDVGARSGLIQIASNDLSDNPFSINLTGQTHTVSFDQPSITRLEAKETVTIPVHLSSGFTSGFTVPFTVTNASVAPAATYTPTASLSFLANATSPVANLTFSLKDDLVIEPPRTITITLSTPTNSGVVLGAYSTFTLNITDNDTAPTITTPPLNALIPVGASFSWNSSAAGSDPLTVQWKKNNVVIAGATNGTFNVTASATLADAASYSMTATNQRSTITKSAQLGVVDQTLTKVRFDKGTTATLTVNAAGTGLSYQWYNSANAPLLSGTGSRYSNVTTKTLSIKSLVPGDAGDYYCKVSMAPSTGQVLLPVKGGTVTLQVPTIAPPAVTINLPDGIVYNSYSFQLPYDTTATDVPTKFTCTGLPAGLTCNASTGLITGKPTTATKAGTPQAVIVTLANGVNHVNIPTSINILAFPTPGVYVGLVGQHAATNSQLGGRLDLTVGTTGSFTGSLNLGGTPYKLTGSMLTAATVGAHPGVTLSLKRTGILVPLVLTLDLDPASDLLTGTVGVTGDVSTAAISGWRNLWHTTSPSPNPVTAQLGFHSFELQLDTASAALSGVPLGYGYGTISVTNTGGTTLSVHTADGNVFTATGVLSALGEVLVFQPFYGNHGSVSGILEIGTDASHTIASHLDWQKYASTTSYGRDYAAFNMIGVDAKGGKYVSTAPVAGLPAPTGTTGTNAKLAFTHGGIEATTNPNVTFRISTLNAVTMPAVGAGNLGKITSLTLSPSTGAFSGKFTLTDSATVRSSDSIPFQGQIVSTQSEGFGYFLLPQLAVPPIKASTTPILSGAVLLQGLGM